MTEFQNEIPAQQLQAILDQEHLKLLSIGYMISAGLSVLFSLFGLMYVFMGVVMRSAFAGTSEATIKQGQAPPPEMFLFFTLIGLVMFLVMITLAAMKARAAWCLKKRRSRVFCLVVGGISCLGIPYGTVIGVFTFIVLGRASVKQLFNVD